MYIRDLQSRVQLLRSDIPAGYAEQALQDAARYVARKTGIVRKRVFGHVAAGQLRIDLDTFMGSAAAGYTILRPTELTFIPGMHRDATYGGLLTAAAPPVPGMLLIPDSPDEWTYYVASAMLVATDGTNSYPMAPGDAIVYHDGAWAITEYWKSKIGRDVRMGRQFKTVTAPMNSRGYIAGYSVEQHSLLLYPVPVSDVAVSLECSIVPVKDFDTVDFPVEAEDAIVELARAQYMSIPNKSGGGANLQLAQRYLLSGQGEVSLVRTVAEGGYGDSEIAAPPRFGN